MIIGMNRGRVEMNNVTRGVHYSLPILFKIIFEATYIYRISAMFDYFGTYTKTNYCKAILSWMVFLTLIFLWAELENNKFKSIYGLLMYLSIIPTLSIYWLKDESTYAFLYIGLYWLMWLASIFIMDKAGKGKKCADSGKWVPSISNRVVICLLFWLIISTFFFSYKYGEMRLYISIGSVYEYRFNTPMPTIFSYLFNWNLNVLLPFALMVCIKNRKYFMSLICILLFLMSYSIYGNKTMLFTIFMILGVAVLDEINLVHYTDMMVGCALIVCQLITFILPNRTVIALLHRFLSIPAEGHYYYYDFFSTAGNDFLYLRESIFRFFAKSPYKNLISMTIGANTKYYPAYVEGDINNMNNGLFSDAFQNFGIVGVLIYPTVIVLVLYVLLRVMREYDDATQFTILISTLFYLSSGYLFSWLLTGGVLVLMVVLHLIKGKAKSNEIVHKSLCTK